MALRIGIGTTEFGRISVVGGKAVSDAPNPDDKEKLFDLFAFYAQQLGEEAVESGKDAEETVTAVAVLKRMEERLQGRTWAIREEDDASMADPEEEDPDEPSELDDEDPEMTPLEPTEPEPTDNAGAWAFNDSGVLIPTKGA